MGWGQKPESPRKSKNHPLCNYLSIVLASKDYRLYIYRYVKVIAYASNSILTFLNFVCFPECASYLIALCAQVPGVGAV